MWYCFDVLFYFKPFCLRFWMFLHRLHSLTHISKTLFIDDCFLSPAFILKSTLSCIRIWKVLYEYSHSNQKRSFDFSDVIWQTPKLPHSPGMVILVSAELRPQQLIQPFQDLQIKFEFFCGNSNNNLMYERSPRLPVEGIKHLPCY